MDQRILFSQTPYPNVRSITMETFNMATATLTSKDKSPSPSRSGQPWAWKRETGLNSSKWKTANFPLLPRAKPFTTSRG